MNTKRYWRGRKDLLQERERKLKTILTLTREKVLKEGWHQCSMRGVIRLLRQHNLNHSYYIPTKLALGLLLAEQEYALLVRLFQDEQKKQYSLRQTLTNCTQLMLFHFRHFCFKTFSSKTKGLDCWSVLYLLPNNY